MVNSKTTRSNSVTSEKCTKALVDSEKQLKKRTPKASECRPPDQTIEKLGDSCTVGKQVLTTSKQGSTKTRTENVANEKKKVKAAVQKTTIVTSDSEESLKESQNDSSNCTKGSSPTHKLCNNFSYLNVDDGLKKPQSIQQISKKKQSKNDQKPSVKKSSRLNKSKSESDLSNHKITDYFQVRRSERKESKDIFYEKQQDLQNKIIKKVRDGLQIEEIKEKGRGIITTKKFSKGDFVIEYIGDLIDGATAKQREMKYAKNKKLGCYMYYFRHKDIQWCIDATKESGELGRLINHSRKGNLISKIIDVDDKPRLVFFAKAEIPIGTELLYDYGDRNREALKHHPWLAL
ncbi:histone-lysine N-methyltransferase set-1 [Copidosoma floridanum]|uniref:histone-lysine N-methyltransferase set-1 n=1 Tax=Copidosoma floridanum TaxID=29053 RepID=UPI0006C9758B|nr:histone-lysine N-methyltransferase set-1 [Copidosoma floridanum]